MMYYEKLQLLKRLTGCFWKNPFLLDDFPLFENLFESLPKCQQFILLPYLNDWISRYTKPANHQRNTVIIPVKEELVSCCTHSLKLNKGTLEVPTKSIGIYSIAGVVEELGRKRKSPEYQSGSEDDEARRDEREETENEADRLTVSDDEASSSDDSVDDDLFRENEDWSDEEWITDENPDLRLVKDIKDSKRDTWWLVRSHEDRSEWFFVKYYGENNGPRCKVYEGMVGGCAWYWKPGDSWEPRYGWHFDGLEEGGGSEDDDISYRYSTSWKVH